MHFTFFIINLLTWAFVGIGLGFFLHKGRRWRQNMSVFIGSMFSLAGGIFSSMMHGMFPEIGIDFFNLSVSFLFGLTALYLFAPNTRESIVMTITGAYDQTKRFITGLQGTQSSKSPYFTSSFWKNITSSIPR